MTARWLGHERLHLPEVDSTSDEVWRRVAEGAAHGLVVVADRQTAGRGRQGRGWVGGEGNLLVSWLLRLDRLPPGISALSLVQGLALARALDRHAPDRVKLKWPNDLLLDGRKLGGLLLESRGQDVVSGLGLNLRTPPEGWGELEGRAVALDEVVPLEPAVLLAELLVALEPALETFLRSGPAPALEEWSRWSALDGHAIAWESAGATHTGRVLGVSPDGGLRVAGDAGHESVLYSGEVHLREIR